MCKDSLTRITKIIDSIENEIVLLIFISIMKNSQILMLDMLSIRLPDKWITKINQIQVLPRDMIIKYREFYTLFLNLTYFLENQ